MIHHVLTLRIFSALKKLYFWQNLEEVFNQLNSTNRVKLHKGHVQGSRGKVTCRAHVQGAYKLLGVIYIYEWVKFNGADSSKVKYRCQLVVRLKANKCYQKLLRYLSSYINLLNIRLSARVFGKCYWQYNYPRVYPDCITGHIASIAHLIADCIILAVLFDCIALIVLLWSYC